MKGHAMVLISSQEAESSRESLLGGAVLQVSLSSRN